LGSTPEGSIPSCGRKAEAGPDDFDVTLVWVWILLVLLKMLLSLFSYMAPIFIDGVTVDFAAIMVFVSIEVEETLKP